MILYADNALAADVTDGTYSRASRSGGGSDGNAYRTLNGALQAAGPGDAVTVRAGTYRENYVYQHAWQGPQSRAFYSCVNNGGIANFYVFHYGLTNLLVRNNVFRGGAAALDVRVDGSFGAGCAAYNNAYLSCSPAWPALTTPPPYPPGLLPRGACAGGA